MAYVLQKGAEEVTERALVPYVVQPIVESGFSTMLVKWLPWSGVAIHSAGSLKMFKFIPQCKKICSLNSSIFLFFKAS